MKAERIITVQRMNNFWHVRLMRWRKETNMFECEVTSNIEHESKEKAVRHAQFWAECDDVPYVE